MIRLLALMKGPALTAVTPCTKDPSMNYLQNVKDINILVIPAHWHPFPPHTPLRCHLYIQNSYGTWINGDTMPRYVSWDDHGNIIVHITYDTSYLDYCKTLNIWERQKDYFETFTGQVALYPLHIQRSPHDPSLDPQP